MDDHSELLEAMLEAAARGDRRTLGLLGRLAAPVGPAEGGDDAEEGDTPPPVPAADGATPAPAERPNPSAVRLEAMLRIAHAGAKRGGDAWVRALARIEEVAAMPDDEVLGGPRRHAREGAFLSALRG